MEVSEEIRRGTPSLPHRRLGGNLFWGRYAFGEEAAQTLLVSTEGFHTLAGDATHGTGGGPGATLVHLQIASLLQCLNLYAQVTPCGTSDFTQIHEVGALQTVEGHHDF